jgi:hypothetical protein
MGMLYLGNAFSLSMLNLDNDNVDNVTLLVKRIGIDEVKEMLSSSFVSCIGHKATADLLTKLLNMNKEIETNRISIKLNKHDRIIIFQLLQRLEEGRVLSEDELRKIPYVFYLVEVI